MSSDFEFIVTSPFDREKLVCEIYYKGVILAEISRETRQPVVVLYSHPKKWWEFPLNELQEVLEKARQHLLGQS